MRLLHRRLRYGEDARNHAREPRITNVAPSSALMADPVRTNHIIFIAGTQKGIRNLYKLVSISHLKYFYRKVAVDRP